MALTLRWMDPNDPDASRLGVTVVIPATTAASRDGLEIGLVPLDGSGGRRALLTTAGGGAARLELGPEKGFFVFSHGDGALAPAGAAEGRAFVDAVARWLGLEADEGASADVLDAAAPSGGGASFKWVRLGDGSDALGQRWEGLKLFLGVQVVVTGCWWVADADVAERAWDDVVSSIRLPTRVRTARTAARGGVRGFGGRARFRASRRGRAGRRRSGRGRRADGRAGALAEPRAAVLEEHRPAPQGRRGR